MTDAADPALQRAIDALVPHGVLIGHRLISPGDEAALLESETASIPSSLLSARQASGAARIVARSLLARLGHASAALPKAPSGEPIWPAGIIGSLAHDDQVAAAAAGLRRDIAALGIDIEPTVPLPADMLDLVTTVNERRRIEDDPLRGRALFAIKEAVYKAAYPLDRTFLEFHDIETDLAGRTAKTKNGRAFALRYCTTPRIIALAFA